MPATPHILFPALPHQATATWQESTEMEIPQQLASVPKMDPQPGSYLCLTVKLLISICKSSSAVTCSFPAKAQINREYTRVYVMGTVKDYITSRQACWEHSKQGTSKKLVTTMSTLEFVTLLSCKAGWQIPLWKGSEFTFWASPGAQKSSWSWLGWTSNSHLQESQSYIWSLSWHSDTLKQRKHEEKKQIAKVL